MRGRTYIAVVGAGDPDPELDGLAEAVGRELARRGAVVVCGGMTGVMEAVCRGAKAEGGTTVGILPTDRRGDANAYVDVAIPTGMGEMRNALVVRAADAVIAIGGGFGTLSEIALARKIGKQVIALHTWDLGDVLEGASSPKEAVDRALAAAE